MGEQAKVTSLDALEHFRARLIVFIGKSRRAIDEATDEIRRTRQWVENDQRVFWEAQVKKGKKRLEQAESELFTARMSEFIDSPTVQQMMVRKARRALEESEAKLAKVKEWTRRYSETADPLARKLDSLRHHFDQVMPHGVTYLAEAQKLLEGYTETPWIAEAETPSQPSTEPEKQS